MHGMSILHRGLMLIPSKPGNPMSERIAECFDALSSRVAGTLRTDAMTRALYSTDASLYQMMPLGVLIPRHEDDVQAALEEAHRFGIPVLPRGGGSSLAGQTVGEALVLDFSTHLDGLLDVNREERRVRVQPGLVLDRLNAALQRQGTGLMVGPDPASSNRATLGGMMANNATGTHSILYGNMIRHVHAARAFLADGTPVVFEEVDAAGWAERLHRSGAEGDLYRNLDDVLTQAETTIRRDTPAHWRRSSGYRLEALLDADRRNLARLLCGSEGTLAVATEITLDLVPRPAHTALGIVHFRTRREALLAVPGILRTSPSAVELLDGHAILQARRAPGFAPRATFIQGTPGAVLITEYYGDTPQQAAARLGDLNHTLQTGKVGMGLVRITEPADIRGVWGVRKEMMGLVMGVKGAFKPVAFIEDAAVPVEHLADYVDALTALMAETGTEAVVYAHASGGCLHVRPFINTRDAAEVEKLRTLAVASMELVAGFGGALSSEHGDGLVRSWLNPRFLGPDLYQACRRVKEVFDPRSLLNPGKVVDAPPMTANLREGPDFHTLPLLDRLDFSADGGFEGAVSLCNGNGACRKLDEGTMCPTFMVLRDEAHSTRGRANALRTALSGTLPEEAFTGPELYAVMDLCIQCKGCKTECPSNVDMARIKTEWLGQYWEENRMPLRTRLFAYQPVLARRMAGRLAGVVNGLNRSRMVRQLMAWTLGISTQRTLPPLAREPFTTWFQQQAWTSGGRGVVLFADTFHNYHHPEVARAAAEFLHRAGYHVQVPDAAACCGRTLLSKGKVTKAQVLALKTVERLYPYAEEGLPIIGLEPSCILTFVDEFPALLPGDLRVQRVAEQAMTFEAFVAREAAAGRMHDLPWTTAPQHLLLHGHCHQKALVGMRSAEQALTLPPHYTVETIDSGCCGMAGAFGYEEEHLGLSLAIAERRLAPAVRAAAEATLIVAAGTSCRAQIQDLTGRHALHPAQVLREALTSC